MPTGYTAILQREPNITFNEFAWRCARAFGACIMQRDDPHGAPVMLTEEPSGHYQKSIEDATSRLAWLDTAFVSELLDEQSAEHAKAVERRAEAVAEAERHLERYRRMLAMVEAWQPPSADHIGFKAFMVQQITDSIKWDCDTTYYDEQVAKPLLSSEEYRQQQITEARRDLDYAKKSHAEELERVAERNEWKRLLVESVGMPTAS